MSLDGVGTGSKVPIARAWEASVFGALPEATAALLQQGARTWVLPLGGTHFADQGELLGIITKGFLRIQVLSAGGRQITFRYASPGDVVGLIHLVLPHIGAHGAHALEETEILRIRPDLFRDRLASDPMLGMITSRETARQHLEAMDSLANSVFGTIRQRIARHLLALSRRDGDRLVCRMSHQSLADAVGSVREVVTRTLRGLQSEGLLYQDSSGVIEILHPRRLYSVALDGEALQPMPEGSLGS